MATGPGHENSAGMAGLGHLRASHADRERVVETLKTAFVQGRLTKDELEARAGQAFAARTYADLAALTADLPAWLADAISLRGAPREPMSNAVKVGIWLVIAVAVPAVLSFLGGAQLFLLSTPFYFTALSFLGAEIAVSRHPKRARHRQLPPAGSASPGLPRAAPVVRPLAR